MPKRRAPVARPLMRREAVSKCRFCKTTWIYGKNRMLGICTACQKIAMRRNLLRIELESLPNVTSVLWVPNVWPGKAVISMIVDENKVVNHRVQYEVLDKCQEPLAEYIDFLIESIRSASARLED